MNDGQWHQIQAIRTGKQGRLIIDEKLKFEGSSPGKMSALNAADELYLGGLKLGAAEQTAPTQTQSTATTMAPSASLQLLSTFSGCIGQVELNSLGVVNLIESPDVEDKLVRLDEGRNLLPCQASLDQSAVGMTTTTTTATIKQATSSSTTTTKRPPIYGSSGGDSNSDDDSDES